MNMESNEVLNQIKTVLGIEVKLETQKLENGTVLEAESFEKGSDIFIMTDDEKVHFLLVSICLKIQGF